MIALLHLCQSCHGVIGTHQSDELRGLLIGRRSIDLILRRRLSEEKARGVCTVGHLVQFLQPRCFDMVGLLRQAGIQRRAIRLHNARHIVNALHASLDLQTVHAACDDLFQIREQAQILRVHDIGTALILGDGIVLSGTGFLDQCILPSTGLGTASAVRIAPRKVTAEQTSSGIGDTHRTVHEQLQLHVRRPPNLPYLRRRELACEHDARRAKLLPRAHRAPVDIVRLCADMDGKSGCRLACTHKDTEIGNEDGICPCLLKKAQIVRQ